MTRSGVKQENWAGTNSSDDLGECAWYDDNSEYKVHSVDSRRPNGVGLFDMSGNMWEWGQDWYDEDYYRNSPRNMRASHRIKSAPADRNGYIGLRLFLPSD